MKNQNIEDYKCYPSIFSFTPHPLSLLGFLFYHLSPPRPALRLFISYKFYQAIKGDLMERFTAGCKTTTLLFLSLLLLSVSSIMWHSSSWRDHCCVRVHTCNEPMSAGIVRKNECKSEGRRETWSEKTSHTGGKARRLLIIIINEKRDRWQKTGRKGKIKEGRKRRRKVDIF